MTILFTWLSRFSVSSSAISWQHGTNVWENLEVMIRWTDFWHHIPGCIYKVYIDNATAMKLTQFITAFNRMVHGTQQKHFLYMKGKYRFGSRLGFSVAVSSSRLPLQEPAETVPCVNTSSYVPSSSLFVNSTSFFPRPRNTVLVDITSLNNAVIFLWLWQRQGNFLTSSVTVSLSVRTLVHAVS
jgi:hypothetical protein